MEKFDWSHTLSAPKGYPILINKGLLKGINETDFTTSYDIWGIVNEGWGRESGSVAVGPDLKGIPDNLFLSWLSLTENKFYSGEFKLPKDRMIHLFENGYYNFNLKAKQTYDTIVVGMAPGGLVIVWLLGGKMQIEVANYQAREIQIDVNDLSEECLFVSEGNNLDIVLAELNIQKKSVPFGLWENYRERYNYRLKMNFPKNFALIDYKMNMFNGEKEYIFAAQPNFGSLVNRAIPMFCNFSWRDEQGNILGTKINFDESEIFKAYYAIFRRAGQDEVNLIFNYINSNEGFTISLRNKTEEYELLKLDQGVYTKTNKVS